MTKLLPILFMSILLSGELEVDGDLKVTGTIQNDSLAQVINLQQEEISSLLVLIAQLQAQISLLESQMALVGGDLGYADCLGVVGGDAVIDNCGICDGNNESMDACGICGGDAMSEDECYVTDVDENTYEIVQIGDQIWMAENLKTKHYANGELIGENIDCGANSEWQSTTSGCISWYNHLDSNLEIYGALYNWYAVDDGRDLCMDGWHVPSDAEWIVLEESIGMCPGGGSNCSLDFGQRGYNQEGNQLKAQGFDYWNNDYGTDEWGFRAVGGGRRENNGDFNYLKIDGEYWTSTNTTGHPIRRKFVSYQDGIYRDHVSPEKGFSIRCIKD